MKILISYSDLPMLEAALLVAEEAAFRPDVAKAYRDLRERIAAQRREADQ